MTTAAPEATRPPEEDTSQCGYQTTTGGMCQNPADDDGRCLLATHADDPNALETELEGN